MTGRLPKCLPVEGWTDADQHAWTAACASGDIFDGAGAAARWRPPTRRKVEEAVGRFLGWACIEQEMALRCVPDLATAAVLRSFIIDLKERVAPITLLGLVTDLGEFMRVAWPDRDRQVLRTAERSLRWRATPSKDKAPRLRPTRDLVALGKHLMATPEDVTFADPRLPLARYRDGLAIALLALCPIRIRAFASLELGTHVSRIGDGWRIAVTPDLSKTRRAWEADLPIDLIKCFEHYLDHVRPKLLSYRGRWYRDPGRALWISVDGSPIRPKALGEAITKRTQAAFGVAIPPHFFRDCAATTLALDAPDQVRLATPLLGHASPKTTERHYNQAQSVDAGRRHLAVLRQLRRRRS